MTPEAQPQAVLPVVSPTKANAENALDGTMPAVFGTYTPTVIALVIAVSIGADLMSDISEGRSGPHMIGMVLGTGLSLVSLVVMWRLMHAYGARAQSLKVMLDSTRTDLVTSRAKTSDILQGLGVLLDRQFAEWSLSPAECEIALLLLKGLSFKVIAEARNTSERTVRQQSLAIYRKAGVTGRAELSAFFFEDMLLTRDPRMPEPHQQSADTRRR